MHIRINIPPWTWLEIGRGLAASLPRFRSRHWSTLLAEEIGQFTPRHAVIPVASARFGLSLGVQLLGLVGKHVAVPAYHCPAVATGLQHGGAAPVAIDCQSDSFRYDAAKLTQARQEGRIHAVAAVNTYGFDQDFALLRSLGIPIIEDAAYQAGVEEGPSGGPACGTRGDIGVWSFNFKALTAVGGGIFFQPLASPPSNALSTLQDGSSARMRFLNYSIRAIARQRLPRFLGGAKPPQARDEAITETRQSLKELRPAGMSELQAAIALTQWRRRRELSEVQAAHSRRLAETIRELPGLKLIADSDEQTWVHLFPVLLQAPQEHVPEIRLEFRRMLHKSGVQTEITYPLTGASQSIHLNAHRMASRLLLLPCSASMKKAELERVREAVCSAATIVKDLAQGRREGQAQC